MIFFGLSILLENAQYYLISNFWLFDARSAFVFDLRKMPLPNPEINGSKKVGMVEAGLDATNISSAQAQGHPINGRRSFIDSAITKELESSSTIPIAICGMSVRLPGNIQTPQDLWEFIVQKRDARGPVPKSRYNASAYHSGKAKPGCIKTEYGYFLDESVDVSTVDTSFFHMSKAEVERTDPHQRQMLEVVRECMEDACETEWKGTPIGCYMGSFGEDWVEMFAKENQQYGLHRVSGYGDFVLANRVSYEMDFTGPRLVYKLNTH